MGLIQASQHSVIFIQTSIFQLSNAHWEGVFEIHETELTLKYCQFINKKSPIGGVDRATIVKLVVEGCSLSHNSAGEIGGALHLHHTWLTLNGSGVYNNTATKLAGGIHAEYHSKVYISDSYIDNNVTPRYGSDILCTSEIVMIDNATYIGANDVFVTEPCCTLHVV